MEREAHERAEELRLAEATTRIRGVLERQAITMVFQPIADLVSGAVVGVEALARFQAEPQRGPDRWFAEAAEVGLDEELEVLAIDLALAQLDRIPEGCFLSLNTSPIVLSGGLVAEAMAPFDGARLVVEVTEHAAVADYDAVNAAVTEIRARGSRLAVDDAGAGFASLQHILRLQPDLIKLDIALTNGVDRDPVRRSLASSLVTFGDEVGAQLIAEGIESAAEQATLKTLGVHLGQGFYLARPGPLPTADHVAVRR